MAVITPSTFDPLSRYIAVRLQQGVPIVDADVNELDDIRSFELRAFIKWFVGDGVPEGSDDAFRVVANGVDNDFTIKAGVPPAPPGADNVTIGLRHVGRLFVDGRDALIEKDVDFSKQPLHAAMPGAAGLAAKLGVSTITPLTTPPLTTTTTSYQTTSVYLDVWDRLVTPTEEPKLIFAGLGTESAARMRRHWAVRCRSLPGGWVPKPGDGDFVAGHSYYHLGYFDRPVGQPKMLEINDMRERRLLMLPATLVEDVIGINADNYRRGDYRLPISIRDAVNALLRDELPGMYESPIAPHGALDEMSQAFFVTRSEVLAIWPSNRGGPMGIWGARWPGGKPQDAVPTAITTSGERPSAVRLPTGDLVVAYQTMSGDILFKRAPQIEDLPDATPTSVAAGSDMQANPLVLRSDTRLVFFWHTAGNPSRWSFRVYNYSSNAFAEPGTWGASGVLTQASTAALSGDPIGAHAVVMPNGQVLLAFASASNDAIAVVRLNPASGDVDYESLTSPGKDSQPCLLVSDSSVYAFWKTESPHGIYHSRYNAAYWTAPLLVPGTSTGTLVSNPYALREQGNVIWLFWAEAFGDSPGILAIRRSSLDGGSWGMRRQVAAGGLNSRPFACLDPHGETWVFWESDRGPFGNRDLYHKRLITSL